MNAVKEKNDRVTDGKAFCDTIDFSAAFEAMPGNSALLATDAPKYTILATTYDFLQLAGKKKTEVIGNGLFETFPANPDDEDFSGVINLDASFQKVITQKQLHQLLVQRYDLPNSDGTFTEYYWMATNKPVLDKDGNVLYILHTAADITSQVLAKRREENVKGIEEAYNLFMQAPVAIQILKGPELIIELANEPTLKLWGKNKTVIGKPLTDVLPELKEQGFIDVIHQVRKTGEPYHVYESPVTLIRNNKEEVEYLNFILQPYFNDDRTMVAGVLIIASEVTRRVIIQKQLAEKEQSLALALEIGELGVFNINLKDNTAVYSQNIMDWFGFTQQHLPMTEILLKVHPEDQPYVAETFNRSISSAWKGKHDITYRVKDHNDDTLRYLRSIGQMQLKDGVAVAISGILQDVTSQVMSRKILEENEHRYRTLIEESTVANALCIGREQRIQYANDIMLQYWGKSNNVIGKPLIEALPELEGQHFLQILDDVYVSGVPYVGIEEKAELLVDGRLQPFYFNFTYKALRNTEGEIYGIHNMAINVTEQVLAKKALEESERNLHNIILQAPVAMCILTGPDFIVEIANDRMLEFWGKTGDELMHKPLFEGLTEAKGQGFEELLKNVYTTGETFKAYGLPTKLPRKGKIESLYINFVCEAFREADGSISGIMAVAIEVTEQVLAHRKIEEVVAKRTKELADINLQLQRSNIELNEFAYIASHDLQEPLRKVRTFTGLMESSMDVIPENVRNYIQKIHSSTERMQILIDDVLKFSMLSKENEKFERVDLNETLRSVTGDYELMIEQKGAKLTTEKLPVLEAIPIQMRQLFTNLLSNSLKFRSAERQLHIIVKAKQLSVEEVEAYKELDKDKVYYTIEFRDNGIGFDQNYAMQIFTIFKRLHGRSVYEGTGIGLALCKKIVVNHRGTIYATAQLNEGAAFTIVLPEAQDKIK